MGVEKICVICGAHFIRKKAEVARRAVKYCSRKCYMARQVKGQCSKEGYIMRYGKFSKPEYEHRIIAKQLTSKILTYNDVVHHKDGNKSNNNPSNLDILTRESHARSHAYNRLLHQGINRETHKKCYKCKQILPLDQFSPSSSYGKKRLSSACRSCCALDQRLRRKQNQIKKENSNG